MARECRVLALRADNAGVDLKNLLKERLQHDRRVVI
jgi:hypothetical protein